MKYRALKLVGFARGGQGVTAFPGAVVEVDGKQAQELVDSGHLEPVEPEPKKLELKKE